MKMKSIIKFSFIRTPITGTYCKYKPLYITLVGNYLFNSATTKNILHQMFKSDIIHILIIINKYILEKSISLAGEAKILAVRQIFSGCHGHLKNVDASPSNIYKSLDIH